MKRARVGTFNVGFSGCSFWTIREGDAWSGLLVSCTAGLWWWWWGVLYEYEYVISIYSRVLYQHACMSVCSACIALYAICEIGAPPDLLCTEVYTVFSSWLFFFCREVILLDRWRDRGWCFARFVHMQMDGCFAIS